MSHCQDHYYHMVFERIADIKEMLLILIIAAAFGAILKFLDMIWLISKKANSRLM